MYSGQGSQYYQMGRELFEKNKIFKHYMQQGDKLIHEMIGQSILEHLYNPQKLKSEPFSRLLFTHPTIFIFEYALTQVLLENKIEPNFVLGTSIGEITAGHIANILDLQTSLEITVKQAQIIEEQCQKGAMIAILADQSLYQTKSYLNQRSELAGVNFPTHFVISGEKENIQYITEQLKSEKIAFQLLPIEYAFHSRLMDSAKNSFITWAQRITLNKPIYHLISSAYGKLIEFKKEHVWDCIRLPIIFEETIQKIENQHSAIYIDVGGSGTLATFVKYNIGNNSSSKYLPLITPFGNDENNLANAFKLLSEVDELKI